MQLLEEALLGLPWSRGHLFQASWCGSCIPSSLSLTWCPCASSPAEQHPAKVQWSAGLVGKRLYALLSQGWWERGSEGKTNKYWLTPVSAGVKVGWGIPFPSLLPRTSHHCWGICLVFEWQHDKTVLLCWENLWHGCHTPLPFGPGACPARHSQHGAGPALHTAASVLPAHKFANNQRTETRTVGGRRVSFELRWWTAAHSYLAPGDLRLAWPGGKKH